MWKMFEHNDKEEDILVKSNIIETTEKLFPLLLSLQESEKSRKEQEKFLEQKAREIRRNNFMKELNIGIELMKYINLIYGDDEFAIIKVPYLPCDIHVSKSNRNRIIEFRYVTHDRDDPMFCRTFPTLECLLSNLLEYKELKIK